MENIITIILFAIIMYLICKVPEWKSNNRTSPDGYKTDWDAMTKDLVSGKSKSEVMRKSNAGGYDVKE